MNRQQYMNEVFNFGTWKDIQNVFLSEAKKVNTKNDICEFASRWVFFMVFDSSIHTIKNRSKDIRDLLSANNLDDLIPLFKIDGSIYGSIKKDYANKIKDKMEVSKSEFNHSKFTRETIAKLTDNINKGIGLSKSNMSKIEDEIFYQKLFVLALSTGRRQIELLKTLSIRKKKDLVIYEGLSKKRNDDDTSCEAPILIDIKTARKWLKDVRDYLSQYDVENMSANQINSKFNGRIGNAIKRYVGGYNFHFFRTCYAHTCYEENENEINIEQSLYFQKILGHKEVLLTAHSYTSK